MEDIEIKVVASELKHLNEKVEKGFTDVKELFNGSNEKFNDHVREKSAHIQKIEKEIQDLTVDMARFKERWLLIGASISVFGSFFVTIITKVLSQH